MLRAAFGVFLVLHGLVHLLYFGQSARSFELQPGLAWPDGSLVFSRLLGEAANRNLAGVCLILAAAGFAVGGAGIAFGQTWSRPIVLCASGLSAAVFILFWDGSLQRLPDKGWIGILIDLAVVAVLTFARWPQVNP